MAARRKRFLGALLLFIGILAVLGVLVGMAVFPDPATRPSPRLLQSAPSTFWSSVAAYETRLIRGWLIVLGTVAAGGVALLAMVASRARYRWFDGALFLVPVYGQLVLAPRLLWRASARPRWWARRPPMEPVPAQTGQGGTSSSLAGPKEPSAVPDAEQIREEARTLAALLSGRRRVTLPDIQRRTGDGEGNGEPPPPVPDPTPESAPEWEPHEAQEAGRLFEVTLDQAAVEPGFPAEQPRGADREPARPRGGRLVVWAFASLLALMALLAGLGASQVVRSRDRDDRLSSELRQARADLRTLREELEAIRTELTDVTGSLPPDVSDLLARVERSVVTVEATGRGIGSGFAIQADLPQGFRTAILTSEHVVRSALVDRRALVAVTRGSRIFRARLGERDPRNDLVILYVRRELPTIPLASEEGHEPRVGDFVVAVGSQPGSGLSATVGVVSKLSDRVIQTDSAIEPGNLGGPLLNRYGEVLGVSTLSPAGSRGLGAAVRIDRACDELVRC